MIDHLTVAYDQNRKEKQSLPKTSFSFIKKDVKINSFDVLITNS